MLRSRGTAVQRLGPNDILIVIGTLIGLLFTAYALLANANLGTSTLRTISGIEFVILLFFILTAFLASFGAAADRPGAWALALGIYPASWLALAIGVGLIFLAIMFPQFPFGEYAPGLVVGVVGAISAAVASTNSVAIYRSLETIRVEGLEPSVEAYTKAPPAPPLGDLSSSFLRTEARLESSLAQLFESLEGRQGTSPPPAKMAGVLHEKGKIGDDDYQTIRALIRVRNLLIHGSDVAEGDLAAATRLASQLETKLGSHQQEGSRGRG